MRSDVEEHMLYKAQSCALLTCFRGDWVEDMDLT